MDPEFKIDIINFKSVDRLFRERILSEAIPINKAGTDAFTLVNASDRENGEIYTVNRDELIQRITDECTKIDRTIGSIMELLQEIEVATPHHRKFFEELTAKKLAEVYSGIERIFERIANEIDTQLPKSERCHTDLLTQMAERCPERPPVISEGTQQRLEQLLRFRHKVNNIYGDELIYEKAEEHAESTTELFTTISEDLDTFISFLSETHEPDEKR